MNKSFAIANKNAGFLKRANAIRPYDHIIAPMIGAHRGLALRN
jgi:hypothetical protein